MLVIVWTASQLLALVISSDDLWSVGPRKNRTAYHSPLQKLSTLLLDHAMLNYYGWSKHSRTMASTWRLCLSSDNACAIKIAQNPVQHSKTKHIQIRHHFLRDHVLKGDISIDHVSTEDQLADIFTKPLDEKRFSKLRCELNILESSNVLWNRTLILTLMLTWWLRCATHKVTFFFNQWRLTL